MEDIHIVLMILAQAVVQKQQNVAEQERRKIELARGRAVAAEKEEKAYQERLAKSWVQTRRQRLRLAFSMGQEMNVPEEVLDKIAEHRIQVESLAGSADPGAEMTPQMKAEEKFYAVPRAHLDSQIDEWTDRLSVLLGAAEGVIDEDDECVVSAREAVAEVVAQQQAKRGATPSAEKPQPAPKRPKPQPRPKSKEKDDNGFSL